MKKREKAFGMMRMTMVMMIKQENKKTRKQENKKTRKQENKNDLLSIINIIYNQQ